MASTFLVRALMVVLVPGVLAFVFGWFAFRSRVTGVYLSIITQALTYALMLAFFPQRHGLRRQQRPDRLQGAPRLQPAGRWHPQRALRRHRAGAGGGYLLAASSSQSKLGGCWWRCATPSGRTRFLGYRVEHYKLFVFVVSAMLAGIAGALYVPQVGIINPGEFAPINSIEAVIWVAVGGRGTLFGAALGAVLVNYAKTWTSPARCPEVWLFCSGALFVVSRCSFRAGSSACSNGARSPIRPLPRHREPER
jgi:urea transport system permease protein